MRGPAYVRELLQMRRDGMRPDDPVVVTDSWDLAAAVRYLVDWFALVVKNPAEPLEFGALVDLDVVVVSLPTLHTPAGWGHDALGLLERIERARPRSLRWYDAVEFITMLESLRPSPGRSAD